jgi:hypothetical protein
MSAKGTSAWYRRHDAPVDLDAERESRRLHARSHGMFDESSERPAFEAWFRRSRAGKGATFLAMALSRHPDSPDEYHMESTQRHWFTWQNAAGGGRLLPKYDPYKLAANDLANAGGHRL